MITRRDFIKGMGILVMIALLGVTSWHIGNDADKVYYGEPPAVDATWQEGRLIEFKVDGEDRMGDVTLHQPDSDIVYSFPSFDTLKSRGPFSIHWGQETWKCKPQEETP
jgi:hypothetical protein